MGEIARAFAECDLCDAARHTRRVRERKAAEGPDMSVALTDDALLVIMRAAIRANTGLLPPQIIQQAAAVGVSARHHKAASAWREQHVRLERARDCAIFARVNKALRAVVREQLVPALRCEGLRAVSQAADSLQSMSMTASFLHRLLVPPTAAE